MLTLYDIIIIMKYTNCPQCSNKIIDRTPLKCLYCGYDSSKVTIEEERIEPLNQPNRPNKDNYTIIQSITLLLSLISAIAFLISFLITKSTVIDGVLVETGGNLSTIRLVLGIVALLSFSTFVASYHNYDEEMTKYNNNLRRVKDINYRIENGANRYSDFDEEDLAFIMNMQELQKSSQLNQKTSSKYYY